MIERHESVVVTSFVRVTVPLAQLFGLYVLVHGHESPGGGFQAGVILAGSYILLALGLGREALERHVDEPRWIALAAAGVLLYLAAGVIGLPRSAFLDYSALPVDGARARWLGILIVETGVMLAVSTTLVVIFCRLAAREPMA